MTILKEDKYASQVKTLGPTSLLGGVTKIYKGFLKETI